MILPFQLNSHLSARKQSAVHQALTPNRKHRNRPSKMKRKHNIIN